MPVRSRTRALIPIVTLLVSLVLAGCAAPGHEAPGPLSTRFAKGVLPAEQDSGLPADRTAVRSAALAALTDEGRAFVVDPDLRGEAPAEVLAAVTAHARTRARAALLGRARSAALARDLQASFTFYARDEFGGRWSGTGSRAAWLDRDVWASSTFHVDRWQGVGVEAGTARVLVRGEDRGTAWDGSSRRNGWAQFKLVLRRDSTAPHGWRIIHQQAASTAA